MEEVKGFSICVMRKVWAESLLKCGTCICRFLDDCAFDVVSWLCQPRVCVLGSVSHSACFAIQDGSNMADQIGTADPLTDPAVLDKRHVTVSVAHNLMGRLEGMALARCRAE